MQALGSLLPGGTTGSLQGGHAHQQRTARPSLKGKMWINQSGGKGSEILLVAGVLDPGHSQGWGLGIVGVFAFPPAHQPPSSPPSMIGDPPSRQLTKFHLTM